MQPPELAIVMPAYNEGAGIEAVVHAWLEVFHQVPGVLIVVNDGSRDNTGQVLDKLKADHPALHVIHQPNAGHGEAVMTGYRGALALGVKYVFQTDSDDQFDREDFWKLWALRDRSPFILGVRATRHDPLLRIVISRINSGLISLLFLTRLKDANIPFRLMAASFIERAFRTMPRGVFAPNIFLSVIAKRAGVGVLEVPVTHRERHTGEVSIRRWKLFKVCLRTFRELIAFRLHGGLS